MSRVLLEIGHFKINIFGVMIALGILAGLWLALREARRRGMDEDKISGLVTWCAVAGVIGARIGYVLFYSPQYYFANPIEMLKIYEGGLSIHGGLVGGFAAGWFYVKKQGLPFWKTADTLAPSIILGQAIGRVGCDIFGKPVSGNLPWAVPVNGQLLHPAQAYEFILDYLLFYLLWRSRKNIRYDGQLFTTYLWAYPLIRGVVEMFRDNPQFLGIPVAQVMSLLFIAAAVFLKWILKSKSQYLVPHAETKCQRLWPELGAVAGAMALSIFIYYGLYW